MTEPLQTWDVGGVRVRLWPSRPDGRAQRRGEPDRWLPPRVSVTYLLAPAFEDPAVIVELIDALAAAGIQLQALLEDCHSGVLL